MTNPSPEMVIRCAIIIVTLFLIEVFAVHLIGDGYTLPTALTAAGTMGMIEAEVAARLLGGGEPPDSRPPLLPPGCSF
jgi:hypothetical protein